MDIQLSTCLFVFPNWSHQSYELTIFKDTLDSVIPEYGACLETGYSETAHVRFYRYIGNTRSSLPDKDWSQFLETMSGRVATGCRNLRNEKIPELSGNPVNHSTGESRASTPTTSEGNGEASSSSSPRHQTSASNSFTAEGPPDPVSSLQPPSGIDLAPDAPPTHKYTSALKEHADIYGAVVTYDKNQLSVYPSSWHCVAKFGDFNGEGTGSSYQKAKHNASKQICYKIGLQVR